MDNEIIMTPKNNSKVDKDVFEWRLSGNLVLLYSFYPTIADLQEDYNNFIAMELEDRNISDDESIRLFNKTNKERYEEMLHTLYSIPEPEYDEFKKTYFPPNKITLDPLDRLFLCREMSFDKKYLDKVNPNNYLKYIQEDASDFDINHDKEELKREIFYSLEQSNMIDDVGIKYPMLMLENMSDDNGNITPIDDDHKKWLDSYKKLVTIGDKTEYNKLVDYWKKALFDTQKLYFEYRDVGNDELANEYKERLIKLGWIPDLAVNDETLDKASINTKNKIEEYLNKCNIIDVDEGTNKHSDFPVWAYFMFVKLNGKYSNVFVSNTKDFKYCLEIGYNFSGNNCYANFIAQTHNLYGLEDRSCDVYTMYDLVNKSKLDIYSIKTLNDTSDFNTPFDSLEGMSTENPGAVKMFILNFLSANNFNIIPTLYKIHFGKVKDFLNGESNSKLEAVAFVLNKSIRYKGLSEAANNDFPVEFDKEGNLIINKGKKLDIDGEYSRTHLALKMYEENKNLNGMKYCLCKLWYMNIILEEKIHDNKTDNDERKNAVKSRAKVMNDIKKYTPIILKMDPNFDILKTYQNSPFNNEKVTIKSSTLFYLFDTIKKLLTFKDIKNFFK